MRFLVLAVALLLPFSAYAAMDAHGHHASAVSPKLKKNPAVSAYVKANRRMHAAMEIAYSGDADADFARGMVPHHQGAVDMIAVLRKYGKDEELRKLADFMAIWQQVEIGQMNRWLETRGRNAVGDNQEAIAAYKAAMEKMHHAMNIQYSGDADVDFARGMVPHHQGAIDMAWVLVEHGRDVQLRGIAQDVIRSQQQEIALMQEWLKKKGK